MFANKTIHQMFNSKVNESWARHELRLNGEDVLSATKNWAGVVDIQQLRRVRLTVDFFFRPDEFNAQKVDDQLPNIRDLLLQLHALCHLELVIALHSESGSIKWEPMRSKVLYKYYNVLNLHLHLQKVEIWLIQSSTKYYEYHAHDPFLYPASSAKQRVDKGWRMDMKRFALGWNCPVASRTIFKYFDIAAATREKVRDVDTLNKSLAEGEVDDSEFLLLMDGGSVRRD